MVTSRRLVVIIISLVLIGAYCSVFRVDAAELHGRSLLLQSSLVSANTTHTFEFTIPPTAMVGSISIRYCDSPLAAVACVAPSGVNVSAVSLTNQSGITDFSIDSVTPTQIVLTHTAAAVGANADVTYEFTGAINPDFLGQFYVRIATYTSTDGTGIPNNESSIAASTVNALTISSEVPPILEFCAAESIPTDCASASGNFLQLGALSSTKTSTAQSQFLATTNAAFGYAVTVNGGTLTSGTNTIPAMTVPSPNTVGNSQFGINVVKNSEPAIGGDPEGGSAIPAPTYAVTNNYKYANGDTLATASGVTDYTRFTVSYIVNVKGDQAPGVYNTTLTYTATATF